MSPHIAGGYRQGGRAEVMAVVYRWRSRGVARSAHNARVDGLRSTLDPYLDEQECIVPADPRPGTENERKGKMSFLLASFLWSVGRTRNLIWLAWSQRRQSLVATDVEHWPLNMGYREGFSVVLTAAEDTFFD